MVMAMGTQPDLDYPLIFAAIFSSILVGGRIVKGKW